MTVRMVREEEMEEAPRLRLIAPEAPPTPEPSPPPPSAPPEEISLQQRQSVVLASMAVLTALAEVVSVRFVLILALIMSAVLAFFGEHTVLSLINAGVFDILVVVPIVALALRKG